MSTRLTKAIEDNGFAILPIEVRSMGLLTTLPLHHRDPFDRMLIAQAIGEKLPLPSADLQFDAYPVNRVW